MRMTKQDETKQTYVDTIFRGRAYRICSTDQMNFLVMYQKSTLLQEAAANGKPLTEEELSIKIEEWKESGCGFIDHATLFSKMTPQEQKQWKDQYKYGGIFKNLPQE